MPSFLDLYNWSRVKASCDIHKYFQHAWSWVSCLNARSASTANVMTQICLFSSLYKTSSINIGLVTSLVKVFTFSAKYLKRTFKALAVWKDNNNGIKSSVQKFCLGRVVSSKKIATNIAVYWLNRFVLWILSNYNLHLVCFVSTKHRIL